eukprot:2127747-Rhodomonas_salina.1
MEEQERERREEGLRGERSARGSDEQARDEAEERREESESHSLDEGEGEGEGESTCGGGVEAGAA